MREAYRRTASPDLFAAAYHESGHAVATVLAFRDAAWLPHPAPPLPVRYVEVTEYGPGRWRGCCTSMNIYSLRWPIACIRDKRYVPLMEAQVVIHLAGGVAEAIHRDDGVFDNDQCDGDLDALAAVLRELRRATGLRYDPQVFSDRAYTLLTTHWRAVEALAETLVEERYIEGERIARIIERTMANVD
jgi:hypothetical protein